MLGTLRPHLLWALCALVLCLGVPSALADVETHVYDSRLAWSDPNGPFQIGESGQFQLPQFDDLGGTRALNAVTLVVEGWAFGGSLIFENESTKTGTVTVTVGAEIEVSNALTTAPLVVLTVPTDSNTMLLAADDDVGPFPDWAGPDSVQAGEEEAYDTDFATVDTDVSEYVGDGMITWNFTSSTVREYSANIAPFVVQSQGVDFHLTATVIYQWEVLPEPASLAVLGFGSAALWWRRRRANRLRRR